MQCQCSVIQLSSEERVYVESKSVFGIMAIEYLFTAIEGNKNWRITDTVSVLSLHSKINRNDI